VLHSCFAPRKRLYMVDSVKNCQRSRVSTYVLYFVCSLCFSLDFVYANGRGGQGRANAMPQSLRVGVLTELWAV
jgi:hypothetical protein